MWSLASILTANSSRDRYLLGFSALGWAEAVGQDGHVTTLEFSEKYAVVARDAFSKNKIDNVEVVVGDANTT